MYILQHSAERFYSITPSSMLSTHTYHRYIFWHATRNSKSTLWTTECHVEIGALHTNPVIQVPSSILFPRRLVAISNTHPHTHIWVVWRLPSLCCSHGLAVQWPPLGTPVKSTCRCKHLTHVHVQYHYICTLNEYGIYMYKSCRVHTAHVHFECCT